MMFQQSATAVARRRGRSRKASVPWFRAPGAALASDNARFIALACFMLLVALTGGGSRPDIQSLVILRPAAVLFCGYALLFATRSQLREVRAPLLIVLAFMLLALLQLVPLPAAVWADLPRRDVVAQASVLVGVGNLARPLSLDPDRTWNTFFALIVPLSTVCLVAIQSPRYRQRTILLLIAVGLLSAILGFLQSIGGNGLHLYDITHRGFPVGLFANKNHQSVLLLWLMLAISWLATSANPRRYTAKVAIGGALAAILVIFPLLVLTGSRAGLMLSLPVFLLSGWLLLRSAAMEKALKRAGRKAKVLVGAIVAVLLVPLLSVFAVLMTSNRLTALSRLFEIEATDDLRWQYLSIFQRMAVDFLPFGSGFGSFEKTFNMYEPSEMLTSRYMNQAHNELMQIAIEGGLPALALLAIALLWLTRSLWRMWRSSRSDIRNQALFLGGSIVLWLAASLVDYPLRTPLAAMLVVTLTVQLAVLSNGARSGSDEPTGSEAR